MSRKILSPSDNQWIARLALARAERDLSGKQTLLLNTKTDSMNDLQRRRHEITLREISIKLQAMRRAQEFDARLKRRGRKLVSTETAIQEGETS